MAMTVRRNMQRARSRWITTALIVVYGLVVVSATVDAERICDAVVKCRKNGGVECDRTKETCPPCVYALSENYTCWEKDPITNTCPFTGVKYDCSTLWAKSASTNSTSSASSNGVSTPATANTSTTTTAAAGKSQMIMYAAIGGGAVVVLIIAVFVMRRRRRGRNMPQYGDSPQVFRADKPPGGFKHPPANTPYANVLETGRSGGHKHHKSSNSSRHNSTARTSDQSEYSGMQTVDSLDGMLSDQEMPAVLGDPRPPRRLSVKKGFKRINSGSNRKGSNGYTDKVSHDVSQRCTNSANVFDEYLRMKKEMKFDADAMSDAGSDLHTLDRFSMASSSTIGGGRAMSITDSEFDHDLMRSRGESDCFSEMSYNDEKYSFSEDDTESMAKKLDREVEI